MSYQPQEQMGAFPLPIASDSDLKKVETLLADKKEENIMVI